jgi:hypothetical protein
MYTTPHEAPHLFDEYRAPVPVAPSRPAPPRPMPTPSSCPSVQRTQAARAALASAHARLVARGWEPQGAPYDLVMDAGVTVSALIADVARWERAGFTAMFSPVTEDGRTCLQAYTRPLTPPAPLLAASFDPDALAVAEAHDHAERFGGA